MRWPVSTMAQESRLPDRSAMKPAGTVWVAWVPDPRSMEAAAQLTGFGRPVDGEGQNRTADTTIFSRVLYQLSYLAGAAKASDGSR